MSQCAHCRWKYPDELLNQLVTSEGYLGLCCGICALDYTNHATGMKRDKLNGTIAEGLRQAAIKWRKTHANQKPKAN